MTQSIAVAVAQPDMAVLLRSKALETKAQAIAVSEPTNVHAQRSQLLSSARDI